MTKSKEPSPSSTTRYVIKDLASGKYLKEKSEWTEELLEASTYRHESSAKNSVRILSERQKYWDSVNARHSSILYSPPHSDRLEVLPVSYSVKELTP